jgi:hypothetical protein
MQVTIRYSVIGGSPRPEIRGTERLKAGRDLRCEQQMINRTTHWSGGPVKSGNRAWDVI